MTDAQTLAMLFGSTKTAKTRTAARKPALRVGDEVEAWGVRGNVTKIDGAKVTVYFATKNSEAWFNRADVRKIA